MTGRPYPRAATSTADDDRHALDKALGLVLAAFPGQLLLSDRRSRSRRTIATEETGVMGGHNTRDRNRHESRGRVARSSCRPAEWSRR